LSVAGLTSCSGRVVQPASSSAAKNGKQKAENGNFMFRSGCLSGEFSPAAGQLLRHLEGDAGECARESR